MTVGPAVFATVSVENDNSILLLVRDTEGKVVSEAKQGGFYLLTVQAKLGDLEVVEVRNEDNVTVRLHINDWTRIIYANHTEVQIPWVPEEPGMYEIRTFAISGTESDSSLEIVSGIESVKIRVVQNSSISYSQYHEAIISLSRYCYYCDSDEIHYVVIYGDGRVIYYDHLFYDSNFPVSEEGDTIFALPYGALPDRDGYNPANMDTYKVSAARFNSLIDEFHKADFFDMRSSGLYSHSDRILVSVWFNGLSKGVMGDPFAPNTDPVQVLANKIDELAETRNISYDAGFHYDAAITGRVDYTIFIQTDGVVPISTTINPDTSVEIEFDKAGYVEVTLPKNLIDDVDLIIDGEKGEAIEFNQISEDEISTTISFSLPPHLATVIINPPRICC